MFRNPPDAVGQGPEIIPAVDTYFHFILFVHVPASGQDFLFWALAFFFFFDLSSGRQCSLVAERVGSGAKLSVFWFCLCVSGFCASVQVL